MRLEDAVPQSPRKSAIILAGGELGDQFDPTRLPKDALVIAADGGFRHARALGLRVHHLIGDLDSITLQDRMNARDIVLSTEVHAIDKNETDLELAFALALRLGVEELALVGVFGADRIDHFIASILSLAHPLLRSIDTAVYVGAGVVQLIHSRSMLYGTPGETVSFLSICGDTKVRASTGLRWKLDELTLACGSSHGMSNEFNSHVATVEIESGALIAIKPGHSGADAKSSLG